MKQQIKYKNMFGFYLIPDNSNQSIEETDVYKCSAFIRKMKNKIKNEVNQ